MTAWDLLRENFKFRLLFYTSVNLIEEKFRMHWKTILILMVPAMIYVLIQTTYIGLPVVGIHSWDESSYIIPEYNILQTGDPFSFYQRFDSSSPDYNDRYVYYWSAWIFLEGAQIIGFNVIDDISFYLRLFSIMLTLASYVLLYAFTKTFLGSMKRPIPNIIPALVAATFLLSPLVLWFGGKAKIEPFGFFLHLVLLILLFNYIRNNSTRDLYLAAMLLGLMVVSRTPFLILGAGYFLILIIYPRWMKIKDLATCGGLFTAGFLFPVLLVQLIKPEVNAIGFMIKKITVSSITQAGSTGVTGNLAVALIDHSILSTLGIVAFVIFLGLILIRGRSATDLAFITLPALLYFGLTYRHNIIHMYHAYYYAIPIFLSIGVLLVFVNDRLDAIASKLGPFKRHKTYYSQAGAVAFACILILPGLSTFVTFYGGTSDYSSNGVYLTDPGGNAYSVVTGLTIQKVSIMGGMTYGYNLVPEPVTGLYSEKPFIGYTFFYKWNDTINSYDKKYNYYLDPINFTSALRNESVVFIVTSPGLLDYDKGGTFRSYLKTDFILLDKVGAYNVFINKSLDVGKIKKYWSSAIHSLTSEETKMPESLLARIVDS